LKGTEGSKAQIFWHGGNDSETGNESTVSAMNAIRGLLRLSGGSGTRDCSSFSGRKSPNIVKVDNSIDIIGKEDFKRYELLKEIIVSSSNQLREIFGFQKCTSLYRIELPSSIEQIGFYGFFTRELFQRDSCGPCGRERRCLHPSKT
jgi:hypothetical protein